jgi:hypothetical protein
MDVGKSGGSITIFNGVAFLNDDDMIVVKFR